MPSRILRDWTDSYTMEPVSADAERLFTRLIMKADDFGRYHADPRLIRAGCFPLLQSLRDTDISRWTAECEKAGLIAVYQASGRSYLAIVNFKQRVRASESKFPPPDGQPMDWRPAPLKMTAKCQANDSQETAYAYAYSNADASAEHARTPPAEPVVPTIEDVLTFCRGPAGIPDEFGRHYVDTCCVKKRWLVKTPNGLDVIDWRREIVRWWTKDRATWGQKHGKHEEKKAPTTHKEVLREVLG